ncbi:MAG: RcnB family protein [Pseudomonadota bacterium]
MKKFLTTAAAVLMLAAPMSEAFAQGWNGNRNDNNRYERQVDHRNDRRGPSMNNRGHDNYGHRNWRKGGRIERSDWNRGRRIDYRQHRLQRPPRGYEWRQVDNNYVLAAAATGLIAALIMSGNR